MSDAKKLEKWVLEDKSVNRCDIFWWLKKQKNEMFLKVKKSTKKVVFSKQKNAKKCKEHA
jgi:hypothetical protein